MRPSQLAIALLPFAAACGEPASPRRPLSVTPASVRLFPGDTTRLRTPEVRDAAVWRSDTPAVASVDGAGLVTALAPGVAAVWAVRGADSTAASVEVARVKCLLGPVMAPISAMLAPGDTVRVEARDGCVSLDGAFTWGSSDTVVAVVTPREPSAGRSSAVVQARGVGQVVITARLVDDPTVQGAVAVTVRVP
jgi:uncharacterized protein YjdB